MTIVTQGDIWTCHFNAESKVQSTVEIGYVCVTLKTNFSPTPLFPLLYNDNLQLNQKLSTADLEIRNTLRTELHIMFVFSYIWFILYMCACQKL